MSKGRPASLDGSLLARKGDAAPAIPPNSPLTEELGEPRPEPVQLSLSADHAGAAGGAMAAPFRWADDPAVRRKFLVALVLAIFAVAVVYTASQVMPMAATVTGESPSEKQPAQEMVKVDGGDKTENTAETTDNVTANAEAVTAPPPAEPAIAASPDAGITAAKKAPVVAVIPPPAPQITKQVPRPAPSIRSGRYLLQLASLPSAREARREVTRLKNRLKRVLGKREIAVVRAVPKGKRPVYRLRASAYRTQKSAQVACDRIRKMKIGCLVVRR